MLKRSLIPTPLTRPGSGPRVTISDPRRHVLRRALRIGSRIAAYALTVVASRLLRLGTRAEEARRCREVFEALGGLWIKAGQVIALRIDVIGKDYADQLSRLQNEAVGFPPEMALEIVERELGPISQVFEDFEREPLAAASIAQVHRARLRRGGQRVVVKVRRPHISRSFQGSFRKLSILVAVLRWLEVAPQFHWNQMLSELRQTMAEELDYRIEASSLARLRKALRRHRVYAPKVYSRHTTMRVLVMEFLEGVFMKDYLATRREDPARVDAWLQENKIDRRKVAKRLYSTLMRQMFEDNLFHADLHPGNIILLRNSRIAFIDFGSVGFFELDFLQLYTFFLTAITERRYGEAADLIFLMANPVHESVVHEAKADIILGLRAWEIRSQTKGLRYLDKSLPNAMLNIFAALAPYRITMSPAFLRAARAELTLDGSLEALDPDYDYTGLIRKTFSRIKLGALYRRLKLQALVADGTGLALSALETQHTLDQEWFYGTMLLRRNVRSFESATSMVSYSLKWILSWGMLAFVAFAGYWGWCVWTGQDLNLLPWELRSYEPRQVIFFAVLVGTLLPILALIGFRFGRR